MGHMCSDCNVLGDVGIQRPRARVAAAQRRNRPATMGGETAVLTLTVPLA